MLLPLLTLAAALFGYGLTCSILSQAREELRVWRAVKGER